MHWAHAGAPRLGFFNIVRFRDMRNSPVARDRADVGDERLGEAREDLVQVLELLGAGDGGDRERAAQLQVRPWAPRLLALGHLLRQQHVRAAHLLHLRARMLGSQGFRQDLANPDTLAA